MMLVLDDLQMRCSVALGNHESPYERRKRILQDQLYGVDVMEWAVRVAELRLWLQLVVETEIPAEQRKFAPLLPNLDLKLRPGDSLLQTVGDLDLSPFRRSELAILPSIKTRLTKVRRKKQRFFKGRNGGLSEAMLKKEEYDLFRDILKAKVHELSEEIKKKRKAQENVRWQPNLDLQGMGIRKTEAGSNVRKRLEDEIRQLTEERDRCQRALQALESDEQSPPFVWDLAFVEVFEDENPGFDIVIGNPPYVRKEKIRDFLNRFDRREYLDRLNDGLRAIYPGFMGKSRRISRRGDYYVYFYLHAMSLLADRGTFCFITSNSWLDADFGKDLQEFFLRHGQLKMVIDNRAKRSFPQAEVNTVIVLAGRPQQPGALGENEMKKRRVRFVAFRVPFEEVLSPVVFSEIEDDALYESLADFLVLKRPEFRSVLWDQYSLYLDGAVAASAGHLTGLPAYQGNKWGGKYLRAPRIFHEVLSRHKQNKESSILVTLSEIAEIRGYIHDNNTGPRYPCVKFIRSIKNARRIRLASSDPGVSKYGVKNDGKSRLKAPVLIARTYNDRLFALWNEGRVLGKEFYKIIPHRRDDEKVIAAVLNSTWTLMQLEVFGITGLGGGGLKLSIISLSDIVVPDLRRIDSESIDILYDSFEKMSSRNMGSVFEDLGFPICTTHRCRRSEHPYEYVCPNTLTLDQVRQASPDRFELDAVVFDVLGLTEEERLEVYKAVAQLVKDRLVKARSVGR